MRRSNSRFAPLPPLPVSDTPTTEQPPAYETLPSVVRRRPVALPPSPPPSPPPRFRSHSQPETPIDELPPYSLISDPGSSPDVQQGYFVPQPSSPPVPPQGRRPSNEFVISTPWERHLAYSTIPGGRAASIATSTASGTTIHSDLPPLPPAATSSRGHSRGRSVDYPLSTASSPPARRSLLSAGGSSRLPPPSTPRVRFASATMHIPAPPTPPSRSISLAREQERQPRNVPAAPPPVSAAPCTCGDAWCRPPQTSLNRPLCACGLRNCPGGVIAARSPPSVNHRRERSFGTLRMRHSVIPSVWPRLPLSISNSPRPSPVAGAAL